MPNRFTKTEKWKDKWFVSLSPYEKLVWNYLCDNCDNAGFFEPNSRFDSFAIGITEEQFLSAIKGLSRGIVFSIDEEKIFIKKFILHQSNLPLKMSNNAHKQIINIINLNANKFEYDFTNLGANEGLISPPVMYSKGNSNVDNKNENGNLENKELSEIEIEIKISEMIVPEMIKLWKNKNPKYFSHAEIDNHAVLQIAYNIATVKKWKKAEILKEKEKECLASFSKIVDYIMSSDFWSKSTLETISKPAIWQKILNGMVERTSQPIANIGQPEAPRYNIYEQVKKYG